MLGDVFWVPLHADGEAFARHLDRLDDAVLLAGGDLDPVAQLADGLMMERVDDAGGVADGAGKVASLVDVDELSREHGAELRGLDVERSDVLIERAAAADVQELGAATD